MTNNGRKGEYTRVSCKEDTQSFDMQTKPSPNCNTKWTK